MSRLKDKIVLITGAVQGIGLACAELSLKEGAKHVFITDIKDELGRETARLLGDGCSYAYLDVTDEDNWKQLILVIKEHFGQLDILINNAGVTGTANGTLQHDLENTELKSWQKVHRINLDGIFLGCKSSMQLLSSSQNGAIVNIGSRSALFGRHDRIAYGSSKAAISNITKSVASYVANKNYSVRCNSVLPSTILTKLWEPVIGNIDNPDPVKLKKISSRIPMKRFGSVHEVAKAVVFLASDDSSYINGIDLIVDGGASAQDSLRS